MFQRISFASLPKPEGKKQIIEKIYSHLNTSQEELFRKKENWRRYVQFLKANRLPNNPQSQSLFKKNRLYVKQRTLKQVAIQLNTSCKTKEDLYYILSIVKDRTNRKECVSSWLFSALVPQYNKVHN